MSPVSYRQGCLSRRLENCCLSGGSTCVNRHLWFGSIIHTDTWYLVRFRVYKILLLAAVLEDTGSTFSSERAQERSLPATVREFQMHHVSYDEMYYFGVLNTLEYTTVNINTITKYLVPDILYIYIYI